MKPEELKECCKAFESRTIPCLDLKCFEDGGYSCHETKLAFRDFVDGWQAAQNRTQPAIKCNELEVVREALELAATYKTIISVTLGSQLEGRISEKDAVLLINTSKQAEHEAYAPIYQKALLSLSALHNAKPVSHDIIDALKYCLSVIQEYKRDSGVNIERSFDVAIKVASDALLRPALASHEGLVKERDKYRSALEKIAETKFNDDPDEMFEIFQSPYVVESRHDCADLAKQAITPNEE